MREMRGNRMEIGEREKERNVENGTGRQTQRNVETERHKQELDIVRISNVSIIVTLCVAVTDKHAVNII